MYNEHDPKFLKECNNVVMTAETHLIDIFGETKGIKAFQTFVYLLSCSRYYWSQQENKSLTLKLLPEVFRALANTFEILNSIYNKEN